MSSPSEIPPQRTKVDQQLTDQFREDYKASIKPSTPITNKMGETVNTAAANSRLIGSATGKELSGRISVLDNLLAVGSFVLSSIAATASRIFGFSESPPENKGDAAKIKLSQERESRPENKGDAAKRKLSREQAVQKGGEVFGVDLGLRAETRRPLTPEQRRKETTQTAVDWASQNNTTAEELLSHVEDSEALLKELSANKDVTLKDVNAAVDQAKNLKTRPAEAKPTPTPTRSNKASNEFLTFIKDSINDRVEQFQEVIQKYKSAGKDTNDSAAIKRMTEDLKQIQAEIKKHHEKESSESDIQSDLIPLFRKFKKSYALAEKELNS